MSSGMHLGWRNWPFSIGCLVCVVIIQLQVDELLLLFDALWRSLFSHMKRGTILQETYCRREFSLYYLVSLYLAEECLPSTKQPHSESNCFLARRRYMIDYGNLLGAKEHQWAEDSFGSHAVGTRAHVLWRLIESATNRLIYNSYA